jgi:hypothetical protein
MVVITKATSRFRIVLKMVHNILDYLLFGLCPTSVLKTIERKDSKTGYFPSLDGDTYYFWPVERAKVQ